MRLQADAGVSPVVAVVLLMGLVAVAGAIIGLSMVAALEDAAGTLPDVRFQASADNQSLYHAGGDALPLGSLVFYNTATRQSLSSVQLTKNGQTEAKTSLEGEVWETGDKITFGADVLKALSIVGLDSRNHPALLYRGVDAAVLPIGDMVPDAWKEQSGEEGDEPQLPDYPYPDKEPTETTWEKLIQSNNQNQGVQFGDLQLFDDGKLKNTANYSLSSHTSVTIRAFIDPADTNTNHGYPYTNITMTIYSHENDGRYTYITTITQSQDKSNSQLTITLEENIVKELKEGDLCYVTVMRGKSVSEINACKTIIIRIVT